MEKRRKTWKWVFLAAFAARMIIPAHTEANAAQESSGAAYETAMPTQIFTLPIATEGTATPTPGDLRKPEDKEDENNLKALLSVAKLSLSFREETLTGDLWDDWGGDTDFPGEGTEEIPYQISTLSHLMGLSEAVAAGHSYKDVYFEMTNDIDLGGFTVNLGSWNPIGWYQNEDEMKGEVAHAFQGNFDGNGNTIYGLKVLNPARELRNIGLFGAIDGGTVKNLTLQADDICGADCIGILAGSVLGDAVIYDVSVSGSLYAEAGSLADGEMEPEGLKGNAGGVAGFSDGKDGRVTVENCTADGIVIHSLGEGGYVGGIVGETHKTDLVDNVVYTQDGTADRIQGKGYVGGIAGNMERTNIYNAYVDGTIGGNGSQAAGGIVGSYESGNLVLARFAGDISRTNLGAAACEGTFIGTRESHSFFTYGTEKNNNFSYLFTNTAGKAKNVFGSRIDGDNSYTKAAHIGYWTENETRYSLVSGVTETGSKEQYFYEELEDGVQSIITRKLGNEFTAEGAAKDLRFRLDHFAPGYQGEPVTGYLLSVPRIDAKNANGTYDTDVALLTALPKGNQSFYRAIDKDRGAAVAPGIAVTVVTAPKNTGESRYQMITDEQAEGKVKPPTYIDELGELVPMNYVAGGSYSFVMPRRDTEINVQYRKVTTRLHVSPEETEISVIHTRSGDRKNPDTRTEVKDAQGNLIARYINGVPDASIEVQPISIHGEHNSYGDTGDCTMKWSVDDSDLLQMTAAQSYTTADARLLPNLAGSFIQEILHREIQIQADSQYQEIIQPTIYEKSAVVTAMTNPETSIDGQPVYGNSRVTVKFQIVDQTTRRVEGLSLNRSDITYTVTRKLTGDRKNPEETLVCSEPVVLSAKLFPQQPFYKNVSWKDEESQQIVTLSPGGEHGENVSVGIRYDMEGKANPAWIQNVINQDNQKKKEDPYAKLEGSALYTEVITATSEDRTYGLVSAQCHVAIQFTTVDETVIHPEGVQIGEKEVSYELSVTKEGDSQSETVAETGFEPVALGCTVSPGCREDDSHSPYDRTLVWSVSEPDVLQITQEGVIIPKRDASWIREALEKPPYTASKTVWVTAAARDNGISDTAKVTLDFRADCVEFSNRRVAFDMVLAKTGKKSSPTLTWSGNAGKQNQAFSYPEEREITYRSSNPELLTVSSDGILTPVINPGAEWVKKAEVYPYASTKAVTVSASDGVSTDMCTVVLNLKITDQTTSYHSSSSGGGSNLSQSSQSAGPGGSSVGTTSAGAKTSLAPAGSIVGTWSLSADGSWSFVSEGRTYENQWAYIYNPYADSEKGQSRADWFRFGENGRMVTGWFVDKDGNTYYLSPVSDNTMGHMVTGWDWIPGTDGKKRCYYFNQVSDGTKGALLRDTKTPDGYLIDKEGAWIVNGAAVLR